MPRWISAPSIFGGFVCSRSLIAYGVPQSSHVVSHQNLEFVHLDKSATGEWTEISHSRENFELRTPGVVKFSFRLGISQAEQTSRDFWTWDRWNALVVRLVINGRAYRPSGASVDSLTKVSEVLYGELVVHLPQGSHSAVLEWKHDGVDQVSWQTVQNFLDGFTGSASVLTVSRSWNEAPTIFIPTYLNSPILTKENEEVNLAGISVSDVDSDQAFVTLQVEYGSLSLHTTSNLVFASGDGSKDQYLTFHGLLTDINYAIAQLSYHTPLNWNGKDKITITVDDQAETSTGGPLSSTRHIEVLVEATNSPPKITLPGFQTGVEDEELVIYGISLYDADVSDGELNDSSVIGNDNSMRFEVSLLVLGGTLSLRSVANLTFTTGSGHEDEVMTFTGSLKDINSAVSAVVYKGNANVNSRQLAESLTIFVNDLGNTGIAKVEETATISLPIEITAVNDAPALVLPSTSEVIIQGMRLWGGLNQHPNATVSIRIATSSSKTSVLLGSAFGLEIGSSPGFHTNPLSMKGSILDINSALETLKYARTDYDGTDFLTMEVVLDSSDVTEQVARYSILEVVAEANNTGATDRVNAQFSPTILAWGSSTLVTVIHKFTGENELFCQVGLPASVSSPCLGVKVPLTRSSSCVCNVVLSLPTPSAPHTLSTALIRLTDDASFWSSAVPLLLYQFALNSAFPTSGPTYGGTSVTIIGDGFLQVPTACHFGNRTVKAQWVDQSSMKCLSPPHPSGQVLFGLSINGQTLHYSSVASSKHFKFTNRTIIYSWEPKLGPMKGGTAVVVHADHFERIRNIGCNFGLVLVKPTVYLDHGFVCESPAIRSKDLLAISADPYAVVFRVVQDGEALMAGAYRYYDNVTVGSIQPSFGFLLEPIILHIHLVSQIPYSGAPMLLLQRDEHEIRLSCAQEATDTELELLCVVNVTSADFLGANTVRVSLNGVDLLPDSLLFEIVERPRTVTVLPPFGPLSGGTLIEVQGYDEFWRFSNISCLFNGDFWVEAHQVAPYGVRCQTPEFNASGTQRLSLWADGMEVTPDSIAMTFYVYNSPEITSVVPGSVSSLANSLHMVVYGRGFFNSPWLRCRLGEGGRSISAKYINANNVLCKLKREDVAALNSHNQSAVSVMISLNAQNWVDSFPNAVISGSVETPRLDRAEPTVGFSLNSTGRLLLKGSGLLQLGSAGTNVTCQIDSYLVIGHVLDEHRVACNTSEILDPKCKATMPRQLGIYTRSQEYYAVSKNFFCLNQRHTLIADISPREDSVVGGTPVSVLAYGVVVDRDLECIFKLANTTYRTTAHVDAFGRIECKTPSVVRAGKARMALAYNVWTQTDFATVDFMFYEPVRVVNVTRHIFAGVANRIQVEVSTTLPKRVPLYCWLDGTTDVLSPATVVREHLLECELPVVPFNRGYVSLCIGPDGSKCSGIELRILVVELPRVLDVSPRVLSSTQVRTLEFIGSEELLEEQSVDCHFSTGEVVLSRVDASTSRRLCDVPSAEDGYESIGVELVVYSTTIFEAVLPVVTTPLLRSMFPTSGPAGETNKVYIYGAGFIDTITMCRFEVDGADPIFVKADVVSSSRLYCYIPSSRHSTTTNISISNHEHTSNALSFITMPKIDVLTVMWEASGEIGAGIAVVETKTAPPLGVSCLIKSANLQAVVPGLLRNSNSIECPLKSSEGTIAVSLLLDGVQASDFYNVTEPSDLNLGLPRVEPTLVSALTGARLQLVDYHPDVSRRLISCRFNGRIVKQISCNGTACGCNAPAWPWLNQGAEAVSMEVETKEGFVPIPGSPFVVYFNTPHILSWTPASLDFNTSDRVISLLLDTDLGVIEPLSCWFHCTGVETPVNQIYPDGKVLCAVPKEIPLGVCSVAISSSGVVLSLNNASILGQEFIRFGSSALNIFRCAG